MQGATGFGGLRQGDLNRAYLASLATGPHIDLNATQEAFTVDGASLAAGAAGAAGPDYSRFTRGAVNVLNVAYNATDLRTVIYSTAINGIDLAPDPAVIPEAAIISLTPNHLEFLRQDRTFLSSAFSNLFALSSQLTLNFANATMGAFVLFAPTIRYAQGANPFGMGLLFNAGGIFENDPAGSSALTTGLSYVGQNIYRANTNAITMIQLLDFISQPRLQATAGGTFTMTGNLSHFSAGGRIDAGATLTGDRRCFRVNDIAPFTGVLTGANVGLDIANITSGVAGAAGIRSVMANGSALRRFILHTGTAESDFAGTINLTGAALLNHAVSDAPGAGAIATLALIGATGPTVAAQATWVRVELAGVVGWMPLWV